MSKILELREKRAKAWDAAKVFLDSKRGGNGLLSAEDTAVYDKMEDEVVSLGKEIERLERQASIDLELSRPTNNPITNQPDRGNDADKTGRATAEYRKAFWNSMRGRRDSGVQNALKIGEDARVSSGKDAMLHSLSSQISYYSNYIQRHREWEYVGVYADEAFTGTKDDRPEFQRLINDCRDGKIDIVITKSIARFARNTVTMLEIVRELKLLGIDVYFEKENQRERHMGTAQADAGRQGHHAIQAVPRLRKGRGWAAEDRP